MYHLSLSSPRSQIGKMCVVRGSTRSRSRFLVCGAEGRELTKASKSRPLTLLGAAFFWLDGEGVFEALHALLQVLNLTLLLGQEQMLDPVPSGLDACAPGRRRGGRSRGSMAKADLPPGLQAP